MKVRLQDVVKHCEETYYCYKCKYSKNGCCDVMIDGYLPRDFNSFRVLYGSCPELAKALFTNEEIEL